MPDRSAAVDALTRLKVLVGQWRVEAGIEDTPPGSAKIEWALDRSFILWSVTIPDPRFPDSLSIISVNPDGETYTQHYFDARGTARIYKMTVEGDMWTLLRDEPDFTPLEFPQRFTGTIARGGETIAGAWESPGPERGWRKDFDLVYHKVA